MDVNTIFTAIGSLGFPVVVAIYMIWTNQQNTKEHSSEIKAMTEAINDLKLVITETINDLKLTINILNERLNKNE